MSNYFLGIHYGHNATVAVAKDGHILFCQSEERLNRIKNSTGFPTKTLDYIYENICRPNDVASATIFQQSIGGYLHLKQHNFQPYQYGHYLSPEVKPAGLLGRSDIKWRLSQWRAKAFKERNRQLVHEAVNYFARSCNLPAGKVQFMKHHEAHAYSVVAHVNTWENALVFTLDGVGDYVSATVSRLANGSLELLQTTDHRNSLGYFYSAITALLGMKAGEHEFKVMGLAPYSAPNYYQRILEKLRKLIWVNDEGQFIARFPPTALQRVLEETIQYERFDNVAGAIQKLVEELVIEWIGFWIKKTAINNVAVAGGVFMNVKACQRVLQDLPISNYFVMPSAADESTAIGAAYWGGMNASSPYRPVPFGDLYLGQDFSDREILNEFDKGNVGERYNISKPSDLAGSIAEKLANNEVIARFSGRMEFGARALGNRSIIAHPSDFSTVELINSFIKNRDFWMPFTPSILEEDMSTYLVNHNRIFAPYMCITFDTTSLAQLHIKAAIHPRDKTARPQCVTAEWNPEYHKIIKKFKHLTGVGAVLNTSFNLHGEPNVCSPADAIHTMDNSGLRFLAIGSYLLEKR